MRVDPTNTVFFRIELAIFASLAACSVALAQEQKPPAERRTNQLILPRGTPVKVLLQQDLNTHKSEELEDVRFEIAGTVWIDDVAVIRKGAAAKGRAWMKSPRGLSQRGEIYLTLGTTSTVDGTPVSLGGVLYQPGDAFCFESLDCMDLGGHAALGTGTEVTAYVTQSVSLSVAALADAATEAHKKYVQMIGNRGLRTRVHIYLMNAQASSSVHIYFDGVNVARLAPGERVTLLPSAGRHLIRAGSEKVELNVEQHGQYYVRVVESGSWPRISFQFRVLSPDVGQDEIEELTGVPPRRNCVGCGS